MCYDLVESVRSLTKEGKVLAVLCCVTGLFYPLSEKRVARVA